MKYLFIIFSLFLIIKNEKAFSNVLPNDIFSASEVIELQMSALQTNSISNNGGIYQCWLFAHPENKKYTGPFSNFKNMIANTSYRILLNSVKFKTNFENLFLCISVSITICIYAPNQSYKYNTSS